MNDICEGTRVADEVLRSRLFAFAGEIGQKSAGIKFAQEIDVFFGQVPIGQNDSYVVAQGGQIKLIEIIAQGGRTCFGEGLHIKVSFSFKHDGERVEKFRMIKRANARLLRDIERKFRIGAFAFLFVYQDVFWEAALELGAKVVSKLPNNKSILIFEVIVERFSVLSRALYDVANRNFF